MVCTVPYLVFVFGFYGFVPESVRWLQCRGEEEKIKNIIGETDNLFGRGCVSFNLTVRVQGLKCERVVQR